MGTNWKLDCRSSSCTCCQNLTVLFHYRAATIISEGIFTGCHLSPHYMIFLLVHTFVCLYLYLYIHIAGKGNMYIYMPIHVLNGSIHNVDL